MWKRGFRLAPSLSLSMIAVLAARPQTAHRLVYAPQKSITLTLPDPFEVDVAATGLRRVRFFAQAPDGRIFVTGMHDLSDNRLGSVFILEGWDSARGRFTHVSHYLDHLRNPNNLAFWTDPSTHQSWLYLCLTDRLVRLRYQAGDETPSSAPETLISFPDYGLNYKYGGWHLTRTVAIGQIEGHARVFVAVGSSCNYCQESEVLRASVLSMDPDGNNPSLVAQGMRNAVDMRSVPELGGLFATDMGDDHLGDNLPEDTFFEVAMRPGKPRNYGWPACYFAQGKAVHDSTPLPALADAGAMDRPPAQDRRTGDSVYGRQEGVAPAGTNLAAGGGRGHARDPNRELGTAPAPLASCGNVAQPYATFAAHSSPLGFEFFGADNPVLRGSFLVALHGASHPHIGTGYRVVRLSAGARTPQDFITGFLTRERGRPMVHGRPCGIFRTGPDSFLLSDDYLGVIYFVRPHR